MVIKMTVPNMVRKENGKGIMYEITIPTTKYMKSRINDWESNRLLFIWYVYMLSLDLKPHIIADDEFTNMLLDQHILSIQKLWE
jgi:hypothetical protein